MASADLVILRYVAESTIGVTPATPALKTIRYTGETLNHTIDNVKSAEITPSRTDADLVQTAASASGAINIELSYGSFDDFIEAAFCGAWSTNVLKNGSTRRSFTIQKHYQDMAVPQFHNYRGSCVEGWNIKMEIGKIVEGSFDIMSFGLDPATGVATSQIAGATFPAASTTTPMNAVTNFQNFTIGGVTYSGCISSMSLQLKNNIRARQCLGSITPKDMKLGTLEITGDVEFYFNEGSNFGAFVAGTEFDLAFGLEDNAGNQYNFVLPRVKYESGEAPASGKNSDVMFSGKIRALYDAGDAMVMSITRIPA